MTRPRRWTPVEWEEATRQLVDRCLGRCEACGLNLGGDLARHHRQRRAVGGDRLSNLVAVHTRCHEKIHAHPQASRDVGLIVSAHAPDPAAVPVLIGGRRWLLHDNGCRSTVRD